MTEHEILTKLKDIFEDTELAWKIELDDLNNLDDFESLIDEIETLISEQEVIYYSNAMEYLADNDNSLVTSLDLAYNAGYMIYSGNLNSEILATLLLQDNLRNELSDKRDELEELFN